jgi:flagellar motor switch protein FliG
MFTLSETEAPPALDIKKMTKVQKLAALLIILGPESAAKVLKSFGPQDLEAVSAEMARMPVITQELRVQILNEMSEVALAAGTALRGGVEFAQNALERAVGTYKANDILNRVSPNTASTAAQRIMEIEIRLLFNLIKEEHIQTITLVASYVRPDKASELLCLLKPELRDQVVERLATLEATQVEVIEKIADVLHRRLSGKGARAVHQTGGVKAAATLLNTLNKNLTKTILTTLEERNAELSLAIRQKMFTFADLMRLETSSLQKVMREVDMRDLAMSLKKSDDVLKAKLLSAISKRAAETVNEEISFMSGVKLKEIEAAQMRIVEIVRKLESDGEIDLETPQDLPAAA